MALEGEFLVEVQKYVSELTKQKEALILDAATGAGETTLQIAKAMRGGKLITVDSDIASWEEWTKPALKNTFCIGEIPGWDGTAFRKIKKWIT